MFISLFFFLEKLSKPTSFERLNRSLLNYSDTKFTLAVNIGGGVDSADQKRCTKRFSNVSETTAAIDARGGANVLDPMFLPKTTFTPSSSSSAGEITTVSY